MSEKRTCPHCRTELEPWEAAPETGWGLLMVCNNNGCEFFRGSKESIEQQGGSKRGYRYAEDPDKNNDPLALVCWMSDKMVETCE
jgi:hypothetical protein